MTLDVAVIGAGWAGLAAAVECVDAGARVTLFEMAPHAGGRARSLTPNAPQLDNGQHICIGAYSQTLALLARIGVAEGDAFLRLPLALVDADGHGLRLGAGAPTWAFVTAVLRRKGWSWRDRGALLRAAAGWKHNGFVCDAAASVESLTRHLPPAIRDGLIEPLCVAALNTPARQASGAVFLRVLRDALAGGRGSADLLLPRRPLGEIVPNPTLNTLRRARAEVRLATRVGSIDADGVGWSLDGRRFDRVVVAASAVEAARLLCPHGPAWAACATALVEEPIVTVYATSAGTRLSEPMLLLHADFERPAQFVFDRGRLGGDAGLLAFVVSGAAAWAERGLEETERAVLEQAKVDLAQQLRAPLRPLRTVVEKRATFRCTPALERPPMAVRPGLVAAGDYIEGPYPATLEGAVRSGVAAARAVLG